MCSRGALRGEWSCQFVCSNWVSHGRSLAMGYVRRDPSPDTTFAHAPASPRFRRHLCTGTTGSAFWKTNRTLRRSLQTFFLQIPAQFSPLANKTLGETISYCGKHLIRRAARGPGAGTGHPLRRGCARRVTPPPRLAPSPNWSNWATATFRHCCRGIWPLVLPWSSGSQYYMHREHRGSGPGMASLLRPAARQRCWSQRREQVARYLPALLFALATD